MAKKKKAGPGRLFGTDPKPRKGTAAQRRKSASDKARRGNKPKSGVQGDYPFQEKRYRG